MQIQVPRPRFSKGYQSFEVLCNSLIEPDTDMFSRQFLIVKAFHIVY